MSASGGTERDTKIDAPPPLVKLLRQLSSDSAAGRITAEEKQLIKRSLVAAKQQSNDLSTDDDAAPAPAPASAVASAAEPLPLIPLLRQLSEAARDGSVSLSAKAYIKKLLLSGAAARVELATKMLAQSGAAAAAAATPNRAKVFSLRAGVGFIRDADVRLNVNASAEHRATASSRDMLISIFRCLDGLTLLCVIGVCRAWNTAGVGMFRALGASASSGAGGAAGGNVTSKKSMWQSVGGSGGGRIQVDALPPALIDRWSATDWSRVYADAVLYDVASKLEAGRLNGTNAGKTFVEPIKYTEIGWDTKTIGGPAHIRIHTEILHSRAKHEYDQTTLPRANGTIMVTGLPIRVHWIVPGRLKQPFQYLHRLPVTTGIQLTAPAPSTYVASCFMSKLLATVVTPTTIVIDSLIPPEQTPSERGNQMYKVRTTQELMDLPPLQTLTVPSASGRIVFIELISGVESSIAIAAASVPIHTGYRCDGCDVGPIVCTRFSCVECEEAGVGYDLCEKCYVSVEHTAGHKFKPITAVPKSDDSSPAVGVTTSGGSAGDAAGDVKNGPAPPAAAVAASATPLVDAKEDVKSADSAAPPTAAVLPAATNVLVCVGLSTGEVLIYHALSGQLLHRKFPVEALRPTDGTWIRGARVVTNEDKVASRDTATNYHFHFGPTPSEWVGSTPAPSGSGVGSKPKSAPAGGGASKASGPPLSSARIGVRVHTIRNLQHLTSGELARNSAPALNDSASVQLNETGSSTFVLVNILTGACSKPFSPCDYPAIRAVVWQRPPAPPAAAKSDSKSGAATVKKSNPEGVVLSMHTNGECWATTFGGRSTLITTLELCTPLFPDVVMNTIRCDTGPGDGSLIAITDGHGGAGTIIDCWSLAALYTWKSGPFYTCHDRYKMVFREHRHSGTHIVMSWDSEKRFRFESAGMPPLRVLAPEPPVHAHKYGMIGQFACDHRTFAVWYHGEPYAIKLYDLTYPAKWTVNDIPWKVGDWLRHSMPRPPNAIRGFSQWRAIVLGEVSHVEGQYFRLDAVPLATLFAQATTLNYGAPAAAMRAGCLWNAIWINAYDPLPPTYKHRVPTLAQIRSANSAGKPVPIARLPFSSDWLSLTMYPNGKWLPGVESAFWKIEEAPYAKGELMRLHHTTTQDPDHEYNIRFVHGPLIWVHKTCTLRHTRPITYMPNVLCANGCDQCAVCVYGEPNIYLTNWPSLTPVDEASARRRYAASIAPPAPAAPPQDAKSAGRDGKKSAH